MKPLVLFLALISSPAFANDTAQIMPQIVDKTLYTDGGSLIMHANGDMTGEFQGQTVTGTWALQNGLYCREGQIGTTPMPMRCQEIRTHAIGVEFINPGESTGRAYRVRN